jgi:caspase domain-containing protein
MVSAAALHLVLVTARIAIVSSSSDAAGQASLRFASRDADRMTAVLGEIGSFAPTDIWTVPRATASGLREALERAERAAEREPGSEILLYYSGHADGEGLLLGGERFTYRELRDRLARSRAQVRVAVLDACNSGNATRAKGGKPGTGQTFAVVPVQVNGAAILAATGAEELAQESSAIEGSYFTHHLISGLRGGGDRDGNGQVTLAEAYAYVYARTVAATVPSLWGAQHPSYDYRLSGTGDLVLTTLSRSRQAIVLPPASQGSYSVLDTGRELVAEVRPDAKRGTRLALPPGRYRIAYRAGADGSLTAAEVTLAAGADMVVDRSTLKPVSPEFALAKGGAIAPGYALFADYALVGRGLATAGISSEVGLTFRRSGPSWTFAPRLAYGETRPDEAGVGYHLRRTGVALFGFRRVAVSPIDLQLGAGAGLTRVVQYGTTGGDRAALAPAAGAAVALEMPLGRVVSLRFSWDAGVEVISIDGSLRTRPQTRAAFALGVRL